MSCINACSECIHRRDIKKDGWIPTCDAFPDGKPMNFDYGSVKERKECNNGIGYEWATGTLKEAPFWREGMIPEEYDEENMYLQQHWNDYINNNYMPLWRQKELEKE